MARGEIQGLLHQTGPNRHGGAVDVAREGSPPDEVWGRLWSRHTGTRNYPLPTLGHASSVGTVPEPEAEAARDVRPSSSRSSGHPPILSRLVPCQSPIRTMRNAPPRRRPCRSRSRSRPAPRQNRVSSGSESPFHRPPSLDVSLEVRDDSSFVQWFRDEGYIGAPETFHGDTGFTMQDCAWRDA